MLGTKFPQQAVRTASKPFQVICSPATGSAFGTTLHQRLAGFASSEEVTFQPGLLSAGWSSMKGVDAVEPCEST